MEGGKDDRWYHDDIDGELDEQWRQYILSLQSDKNDTSNFDGNTLDLNDLMSTIKSNTGDVLKKAGRNGRANIL
jgi:hypothetical protein